MSQSIETRISIYFGLILNSLGATHAYIIRGGVHRFGSHATQIRTHNEISVFILSFNTTF